MKLQEQSFSNTLECNMGNYLVAGGSSGIGKGVVEKLLHDGHRVHVIARNQRDLPNHESLSFSPWSAEGEDPNLSSLESLNGVVYAPGTILLKPFHRYSNEEITNDFTVNTLGAVKVLRAALPLLKKEKEASVVLFSTVAVQTGMPFHASISMAKGAVEGLTRSLAAEWAPLIRVNCIAPSLTDTPLAEKLLASPEKKEASAKRHPLNKVGSVEDLASAVLFLLTPHSSWISGQVLHVDGGMSSLKLL